MSAPRVVSRFFPNNTYRTKLALTTRLNRCSFLFCHCHIIIPHLLIFAVLPRQDIRSNPFSTSALCWHLPVSQAQRRLFRSFIRSCLFLCPSMYLPEFQPFKASCSRFLRSIISRRRITDLCSSSSISSLLGFRGASFRFGALFLFRSYRSITQSRIAP